MFFSRWFPMFVYFFIRFLFLCVNPADSGYSFAYCILLFVVFFLTTVFYVFLVTTGTFIPKLKKARRSSDSSYGGLKLNNQELFLAAVISDHVIRTQDSFGYHNSIGDHMSFHV